MTRMPSLDDAQIRREVESELSGVETPASASVIRYRILERTGHIITADRVLRELCAIVAEDGAVREYVGDTLMFVPARA